jgi:sialidase-1
MKRSFKWLSVFATSMLITATAFSQAIVFEQYKLPVLIGRERNPVAGLVVTLGSDQSMNLTSLKLSLRSSAKQSLSSVSLLSLGQDSIALADTKMGKATRVGGAINNSKGVVEITGSAPLKKGKNYFIITAAVTGQASLFDSIQVMATQVRLGKRKIKIPEPAIKTWQRLGTSVRRAGEESVVSHRIPGIATAKDGSLLSIYDARRLKAQDLQGHIDIGLSRSFDKGKTWQPMQVVLDMGEWGGLPQKFNGVSDACILVDKNTGDIYVAGLWMYGVIDKTGKWVENLTDTSTAWNHQWRDKGSQPGFDVKQTSQFLITKSTDNGNTWSEPVNLTKMCKKEEWWLWAPAPGAGITLADGTLVFPTQGRDATGKAFSNITYSKDGGITWTTSKAAVDESTTENMAVELSDGTLMLNMRANANKGDTSERNGRAIAVTKNLGQTWEVHPTSHNALQEPVCMASIIRHEYTRDGQKKSILIFCNPDSKVARNKITLKVSYDDGNTWHRRVLLDQNKGRGYSCLTSVDENTIGVLYESSQSDLVFQAVKLEELL